MVWTIYDETLLGAATARLTVDDFGEVLLVGGTGHRRWINELDDLIAAWMRAEGMRSVRAYGRKGWVRVLKNWAVLGNEDDTVIYERIL